MFLFVFVELILCSVMVNVSEASVAWENVRGFRGVVGLLVALLSQWSSVHKYSSQVAA